MKYTYNQYLYIPEAICCLVLSTIIGLAIMYTWDRTIGLGVAITGCVVSALFHATGQSRSRFEFTIQSDGLAITCRHRTAKILWSDIANITEDKMGLHIHIRSTGAELPVLNDMVNYNRFRQQVFSAWKTPKQYVDWA